MRPSTFTGSDMLLSAIYCLAAVFLFLLLRALAAKGLAQMRLLLLAVTGSAAIAVLMFLPGLFLNLFIGIAGLNLMEVLPLRMFVHPHSEAGRLWVRVLIGLFFLTTFLLLLRTKKPQTGLMAGVWLIFLTVNLAELALHTYNYFTYRTPQTPVQRIEAGVNSAGEIFEHIINPRRSWIQNNWYPLLWVVCSVAALVKLRCEQKRYLQTQQML